jgi:hypothetical protein
MKTIKQFDRAVLISNIIGVICGGLFLYFRYC